MLRSLTVFWLIVYSLRYLTRPWNFFQLNSNYYNSAKNIFSKLEINSHIPRCWRLPEVIDDGNLVPDFPVYVKPEWGQNSLGIAVARNQAELDRIRHDNGKRFGGEINFLLQNAAQQKREFEIFYIRDAKDLDNYAILSLTETLNESGENLIINGINNKESRYRNRAGSLSPQDCQLLWSLVRGIGFFRIGRVGVRADSIEQLLAGEFHVIEINIFLPMPLVLLDEDLEWRHKHRFIRTSMRASARLAAAQERPMKREPIFFRKLAAHYKIKE
jgi:hypothetical protein